MVYLGNLKQLFYGTYSCTHDMTLIINIINFHSFSALHTHTQVRWVMQQHEKIRKKRDFQPIKFPTPSATRARDPLAFLRSIANGAHIQYRSTDSHLIFPDPLYKEQWYLVSTFSAFIKIFFFSLACRCECENE
jgi:hypothetical protein